MNEAAWNLAGRSVDGAQDAQVAAAFTIFTAALADTRSRVVSTAQVYDTHGNYVGSATVTTVYDDPVKRAEQAAAIAAGAASISTNQKFITIINDFLIDVYREYDLTDTRLSFHEWLVYVLKWSHYPHTNYDHNLYVDMFKPWGYFWENFEFEFGYFYSGIPYLDLGLSLHFYGLSESLPGFWMFSPKFDFYLYPNAYNKGLYLKSSIGSLTIGNSSDSITVGDFRQDLGCKMEFPVTSVPSGVKMFMTPEVGYGVMFGAEWDGLPYYLYWDVGLRLGVTF